MIPDSRPGDTADAAPKLPGWTRRSADLTPTLDLWTSPPPTRRHDVDVFLDPSNSVAYKMIGGAYGVLGAEVLGHYVPRLLDADRWGVYVREAGVAWLCSQVAPRIGEGDRHEIGLVRVLARAVAAHHLVHFAVEKAFAASIGSGAYLQTLWVNQPRHPAVEETLADALFDMEMEPELIALARPILDGFTGTLGDGDPPEARNPLALAAEAEKTLGVSIAPASLAPGVGRTAVPHYLVLEPHLPDPTAREVRRALLPGRSGL